MESAFLKAITDSPDDTTARLVFADWLREQDAPALNDRGEFVHAQHALVAGNVPRDQRPALVARQKALLAQYRDQWDAPFHELIRGSEYYLGFAERLTFSAEQLVDNLSRVAVLTPVVRVRLSGLTADTVEFVAGVPELSRVRELDLNRQSVSAPVLRELLASPHLGQLRYLNLTRTNTGDDGVRAVVASGVFRQLRYLNIAHAGVSASGVRALVSAIYNRPGALEVLVLKGAPRLESSSFPPVPPGLSFRLRQSLAAQIGLGETEEPLFARLYRTRAALSTGFRRLVEWLHTNGSGHLPHGAATVPLPVPVRTAFTLVCERRIVWRAERAKLDIPALSLDADGNTELREALRQLVALAGRASVDPKKEAHTLTNCLLDLYQRHERGELPADGRTR